MLPSQTSTITATFQLSTHQGQHLSPALQPLAPTTTKSEIRECIASFIYPSLSEAFQPIHTIAIVSDQLPNKEENWIPADSLHKFSSDKLIRMVDRYENLCKAIDGKLIREKEYRNTRKTLQEVCWLVAKSRFKWSLIWWLDSLARLVIVYPQYFSNRYLYILKSVLTVSSPQVSLQWSYPIKELLNMIFNIPRAVEDQIWLNYLRYQVLYTRILEDKDHIVNKIMCKTLNRKCLPYDIMGTIGVDGLESKGCTIGCHDDELENHEEYSTTSGSSRTGHDCHTHDGSKITTTIVTSNDALANQTYEMFSELYDGCYFGDLRIPFGPEDKLLIPEDEFQERASTESSSYWERDYYRYSYKSQTYDSPRKTNYSSYQQKHNEGGRKGYYISYEPKQKTQEPVQATVTVASVASSKDKILTSDNSNFPDLTTVQVKDPTKLVKGKAMSSDKRAELTLEVPKSSQDARNGIRERSWESQMSFNSQKNNTKHLTSSSSLLPNTSSPLKTKTASKNQQDSKIASTKKKANGSGNVTTANPKQGQDKGDFKLWDMINVKGKLKMS